MVALYLLLRDHKLGNGAIEVGWRVGLVFGRECAGDVIWSYHSSLSQMLEWARDPVRGWRSKMPMGVIDERDLLVPEDRVFESVPPLRRLPYFHLPSDGGVEVVSGDGGGSEGISKRVWVGRREVYSAAFGVPVGSGSVRDRLRDGLMRDLNRIKIFDSK